MTVMAFGLAPPATTAAVPGTPVEPGAAPTDFAAAFLAAMDVPPLVEEGALAPVSKPGDKTADDAPGFETVAAQPPQPTGVIDPALAALLAQQIPVVAPGWTGRAGLPQPTDDQPASEATPVPVSKPTTTPEPAVAGKAATTKERVSVPAEIPSSSNPVSTLPATAIQPSSPQPPAPAAAAAPVAAPVAHTSPLDRVSAQVFPEVTGLVSRGNGTHRITMTLNPEQLGEVRVVMTVRDGVVHVRMAAGHETRAALLDGSPELSRLLESTGATETRIVVRDLPAAPITPTNPSSDPNNGSLDQHAGTRADHQAKDGSDQNTPRPTRAEGTTSPGPAPRSIHPVIDTRTAGVDLTM